MWTIIKLNKKKINFLKTQLRLKLEASVIFIVQKS